MEEVSPRFLTNAGLFGEVVDVVGRRGEGGITTRQSTRALPFRLRFRHLFYAQTVHFRVAAAGSGLTGWVTGRRLATAGPS